MIALIAGLFALDNHFDSSWAVSLFAVILGVGAWVELARLARVADTTRGGSRWLYASGLSATLLFLSLPWLESSMGPQGAWLVPAGVAWLLFTTFAAVVFRADYEKGFAPLLGTVVGVLLFALLFSYAIRIYQTHGTLVGLVFILGTKGNDIAAYLVGRAIGRTHFLQVSPKKSLEGCLAAVVFSLLWFVGAALLWPEKFFPWPVAIPFAIILSVTTQVGDLSESLMKRCYQVKDSSALIPEFGGILDLIDSVLFSAFFFWIVSVWI